MCKLSSQAVENYLNFHLFIHFILFFGVRHFHVLAVLSLLVWFPRNVVEMRPLAIIVSYYMDIVTAMVFSINFEF